MADLNALIAQGAQFRAPADPFVQYGQIQQLQQAESTNKLNQMQMEEYQRKTDIQKRLSRLDPTSPDYLTEIKRIDPKLGFEFGKLIQEGKNQELTGTKTLAETAEAKRKLLDASMRNMASNPSDENIIAHMQDYSLNPLFKDELASIKANAQKLLAMPLDQRKTILSGQGATAADLKPPAPTDIAKLLMERDALPINHPNRRIYDQQIADLGLTNRVAQQRLAFEQSKFNWEKANPGFELKQAENGDFFGINKRTLQATPVTIGGAVPPTGASAVGGRLDARTDPRSLMATEPAVGGSGIPSNRMAPTNQLTPAVAPVEGASVAGTPFKGKHEGLKPIPANINLAIIKNNQGVKQLSDTIKLLEQNPNAVGFKGFVPGAILNRADPEGVDARAGVADVGSLVMHERSGAAVTAAESPRLVPFIPLITDDKETVVKKLKRMRTIIEGEQKGLTETYSKDQGYLPNPVVGKIADAEQNAPQMPPMYATNGKERIMSTDGGQTWVPAK